MDWKIIIATFSGIFLAELGDKTQVATFFAAANYSRLPVFIGAASALIATSLIAVLVGGWVQKTINPIWIRRIAAVAFIAIGILMLLTKGSPNTA